MNMMPAKAVSFDLGVADATGTAAQFLCRHGDSLCQRLAFLEEGACFYALEDMGGHLDAGVRDPGAIEASVRDIQEILGRQTAAELHRLATEHSFHAGEAVRWYGARVEARRLAGLVAVREAA